LILEVRFFFLLPLLSVRGLLDGINATLILKLIKINGLALSIEFVGDQI
jgi:hypothetical protein